MIRATAATIGVFVAVALLTPADASAQCAMCRRALQSPEGQQMIGAFRNGILVLLAAPFASFAAVAALVVRLQRRRAASDPAAGSE